jgi:hypothetical protein
MGLVGGAGGFIGRDFPSVADGRRGVAFVNAAWQSQRAGRTWVTMQ